MKVREINYVTKLKYLDQTEGSSLFFRTPNTKIMVFILYNFLGENVCQKNVLMKQ